MTARYCKAAVLVMATLLAGMPVRGEVFDDAGVAAPFVKISQGARASAMGEAFTAVADDSTAVFWNPAGLAQIGSVEAQFTYNSWIQGFDHHYGGLVFPYAGSWGIAYSLMDMGEFAEIDSQNKATGRTFSVNGQVFMIGYARGFMNDSLLIGLAAKTVKEDLGDGVSGQTTALDLGVIGLPFWDEPRVALAAVIENLGGELAGFDLPLAARIGISWRRTGVLLSAPAASTGGGLSSVEEVGRAHSRYPWQIRDEVTDSLLLAADLRLPQRGRAEVHGGAEYWLSFIALRVGYKYRFPRNELGGLSGLTFGIGLRGKGFQFDYGFDYSYAPMGELGDASRFTVSVGF